MQKHRDSMSDSGHAMPVDADETRKAATLNSRGRARDLANAVQDEHERSGGAGQPNFDRGDFGASRGSAQLGLLTRHDPQRQDRNTSYDLNFWKTWRKDVRAEKTLAVPQPTHDAPRGETSSAAADEAAAFRALSLAISDPLEQPAADSKSRSRRRRPLRSPAVSHQESNEDVSPITAAPDASGEGASIAKKRTTAAQKARRRDHQAAVSAAQTLHDQQMSRFEAQKVWEEYLREQVTNGDISIKQMIEMRHAGPDKDWLAERGLRIIEPTPTTTTGRSMTSPVATSSGNHSTVGSKSPKASSKSADPQDIIRKAKRYLESQRGFAGQSGRKSPTSRGQWLNRRVDGVVTPAPGDVEHLRDANFTDAIINRNVHARNRRHQREVQKRLQPAFLKAEAQRRQGRTIRREVGDELEPTPHHEGTIMEVCDIDGSKPRRLNVTGQVGSRVQARARTSADNIKTRNMYSYYAPALGHFPTRSPPPQNYFGKESRSFQEPTGPNASKFDYRKTIKVPLLPTTVHGHQFESRFKNRGSGAFLDSTGPGHYDPSIR